MPVLALMYHDVVARDPDASGFPGTGPNHYKVRADRFRTHLDAIERVGPLPSLIDEPTAGMTVLLTFDDGGGSASTQIAPMLERRGWRGHFFVTTERIDTPGFLTRDQLLALHDAGHHVGSHARTHRALTGLSDDEVLREWAESKAVLEDLLGARVTAASVPTGRYSERIATLAAHVGYDHLFTSEPWLEPRRADTVLVYGRYAVHAGTSAARITALCSLSRPTLWWMGGGWYARKTAKTILGPVYDPLRRRLLARMR